MSEKSISEKISSVVNTFLHPNANRGLIMSASAQLNALVKDIKNIEDENSKLKARIQELESSLAR